MILHELNATDAVQAMRAGRLSPTELLRALLDRVAETEPRVQAWETLDAEGALAEARRLEAERSLSSSRPLFGLPIGVKDVFHVRGLPTTANFDPYRGRIAQEDSGVVRHLREAGAIILGKTVTVQFACGRDPAQTRNPWNVERTPGGSSSGSGAAVAARQVPAAIGTQTGGSVLRPAAYCGVAAIKPTFGRMSRHGLLPVSWTLDHPGIFARTVADLAALLGPLARHDPADPYSAEQGAEEFVGAVADSGPPPRLGLVRDLLDRAEPVVREAAEIAARRLAEAGADVREVRLPISMDQLLAVHHTIMISEASAVHAEQHGCLAEHYRPGLRAFIETGQLVPASAYVQARRLRRRMRAQMIDFVASSDAVIGPTVSNLPPDLVTTGDPSLQSIWTLFGFPNVTLPTVLSPERLPHAIQIVGHHFQERDLLRTAAWCEARFDPLAAPV